MVPKLPRSIIGSFLPSEDVAINSVDLAISWLNELAAGLPSRYGWRFRTVDALKAETEEIVSSGASVLEVNQLY
jgi:hypothetical protein